MGVLEFTIPHNFVQAALRGPALKGYDVNTLLTQAGIVEDVLNSPMSRVTAKQFAALVKSIWLTMHDEFMGLGRVVSPLGSFAMMCHATIHRPTLEKAYARAYRFYGLFLELPEMTLERHDDYAVIKVDGSKMKDPDHFLMESLLVIWHRFGSWLIGRRIHLIEASFDYAAPDHASEYRRLFHCDIHFDQSYTGLKFPVKFLQERLIQNEGTLKTFLKNSPADLLARPDEGDSLVAQIRAIIGDDLSQELPNFEFVASQLHTSAQTLRRRLKEEGLTYQELKDQMRRDTALYLLEQGDLSIHEIAERLGFSEPSTFHRAFKKWTGITPGAYRQGEEKK